MSKIFFTPGPSHLHPKLHSFLEEAFRHDIGSISHRSTEFKQIFQHATRSIRTLMGAPEDHLVFFLGSATEAMERIIQNCAHKRSHHLVNGSFSERFFSIAQELGKSPSKAESSLGRGFRLDGESLGPDVELLCITHNETSTGVSLPINQVKCLAETHPDTLVAIDVVSSAPAVCLPWAHVDCAFFSVQKLFGLPAGLGVLIVSPRAVDTSRSIQNRGISIGSFHNFQTLAEFAHKSQTPETPNVLLMYLLAHVCDDLALEGQTPLSNRLANRARVLYDFLDHTSSMSAFVQEPEFRSNSVISVVTGSRTGEIISVLAQKGIVVGEGYGPLKGSQLRIANFPACSDNQWELLIDTLRGFTLYTGGQ